MAQVKVKVIPQQAELAQEVPGRLRPRIFLTFSTTRVVGRQPYAPAAFTPGEIPVTHFQGPDQQLENHSTKYHRQRPLYNTLELLMMGIVVPETC